MSRSLSLCGASALFAVSMMPVAATAQGGPCLDDIAKLSRQLGTQVGLGASVSEPGYGHCVGPNEASVHDATTTTASAAKPVGFGETDRAALKQRCSGDYVAYCGDLAPEGPEVRACFRRNMANLSPACRAEIERHGKGGARG